MLRLLIFLPILALPFLATACDGGSDEPAEATIAVRSAARDTSADSARIHMRLAGIHPTDGEFGGDFAEGEVDFATGVAELRVSAENGNEPGTLIYIDGKVYQSWRDTPYWMESDSEIGPALGLEPIRMLELIARADDVEVIATEELDGVQATHYRFSFATEDLSEAFQDSQKGMTGAIDVWISDDRVHRTVSAVEYGSEATEGLRGLRLTTDVRLSDWGIEVNVAAPDASLVKTFEELQALE